MKHKTLNKTSFKVKPEDIDEKGRVVIAVNAFGNLDSDNEISAKGAFTKTLKENFNRVKWFLNHNRSQLLGVPIEAVETDEYLQVTGQLNMNKQLSRDIYEDYRLYAEHGKTLEHSIGVDVIKRDSKDTRIVLEYKLWEFSTLTNWGANANTPLLSIKSENEAG
jgi:HK97 family phage prohead protease